MNDIKLRPCPFCGSEAYLIVNDGARVLCPKCGAEMEMDREMFLFQRFKNMSNSIIHKNMSNSCV